MRYKGCLFLLLFFYSVSNCNSQDQKKIVDRIALLENKLQTSSQYALRFFKVLDMEKIGIMLGQIKNDDKSLPSNTLGNVINKQQIKLNLLEGILGSAEFDMGLQDKNITQAIRILHQRYCQMYAVLKYFIEQKKEYRSNLACMQKVIKQQEIASMRQAKEITRQKHCIEKLEKMINLIGNNEN